MAYTQDLHVGENWRAQQRELDGFRHDYNHVRPHEALKMQTPASVYEPSPRPYPARLAEIEYPDMMEVRTVKSHGHFRWEKQDVFLSEVLWGEPVGLLPELDGTYTVHFAHVPLARFDPARCKLAPLNRNRQSTQKRSGPGQACPGPENQNLPDKEKQKLAGMRPV
jgi:hypothetical protein